MSQSQQHATTCKPKRVMRLLCRNNSNRLVSAEQNDRMYPMQPVLLQQYPLPLLPPSVRSVLNTGSKFVEETIAVAIRQNSRVEKTKLFIY